MSNLLPKERLELVWDDYRNRLILTGALVLLGAAIFAGNAFLPAYVALKVGESEQEKQNAISILQSDPNPQSRVERADILRSQTILSHIAPIVFATSSLMGILNSALELRPNGVTVSHINIVSGKGGSVIINGEASGRDEINRYRDSLSKDARFEGVSIPVDSLVGSEGGAFTITLTGNF